ncbi:hypothetical protein FGIG_12012 [Fasciola gigantica]|uniref:Uncharacterized protein n=1 Tax=Fasciola gigantica TaxID=46835 RepID=A0A504YZS0_FASGI|nr:hypothetical protein FGIG_12012 [Fasciola gigantica]
MLYACVTPMVLLIGLVGNSLCLLVFRVKRLRSTPTGTSCATILSALSAADLLVLICHVGPEWIQTGLPTLIHAIYGKPGIVPTEIRNWTRLAMRMMVSINMSREEISRIHWPPLVTTEFLNNHSAAEATGHTKDTLFLHQPGMFQLYIMVSYVLRMMSVWLLVLFTVERYIGKFVRVIGKLFQFISNKIGMRFINVKFLSEVIPLTE